MALQRRRLPTLSQAVGNLAIDTLAAELLQMALTILKVSTPPLFGPCSMQGTRPMRWREVCSWTCHARCDVRRRDGTVGVEPRISKGQTNSFVIEDSMADMTRR